MIERNVDDSFERAYEFAKKHKPIGGLSNIYVIHKIDESGNQIGEYYGMNLMTDYGMTQYFSSSSISFPTKIYIGNGTGSFSHTSNTLLSPVTTTGSTVSSSTINYEYPMYYDSTTGLITCVCKFLSCYFDYNISGITNPFNVTEYGIGTAYNALWTHSWVYDNTGSQTYVVKEPNVRLEIDVYLCMSYHESLIMNGWDNNQFSIITTMKRFIDSSIHMYETAVYTYKRFNVGCSRSKTNTRSAIENNRVTSTTNMSAITLYNESSSSSTADKPKLGYINGFVQWVPGFITLEPQELSTPESFSVIDKMDCWGGYAKDDGFGHRFGEVDSVLPITQADITSVSLYNYKGETNAYDNEETFINSSSHMYCETPIQTFFSTPIHYKNNNSVMTLYVFQNIRTDDPIIRLDNTLVSTIYVTDKYWDTSTWIRITDFSSIPVNLQTKRYWITNSNSLNINPVRQSSPLTIQPSQGGRMEYSWISNVPNGTFASCDNYEYKWFKRDNKVYAVENNSEYTIGSVTGLMNISDITYSKWLLTFNSTSDSSYSLTDMTDLSIQPVVNTNVAPFTDSTTNLFTNAYRTSSGTGIVCINSRKSNVNESVIIDLRDDVITQTLKQTGLCCTICGTNRIAYVNSSDTTKIDVYDIDTSTVVRQFTIPDDVTNVSLILGLRDYIWITNGTSYTYVMKISDGTITGCDYVIPLNSDLNKIEMTFVDDVIIVYKWSNTSTSFTDDVYIRYDNPTSPMSLSPIGVSLSYVYSRIRFDLRYVHDNTLVLSVLGYRRNYKDGAFNYIIDFGLYLDSGTIDRAYQSNDAVIGFIPYGESYMIGSSRVPIEYYLSHKITGTTSTISSINVIKSITGKTWSTVITNIPEFNGKPPGVEQSL